MQVRRILLSVLFIGVGLGSSFYRLNNRPATMTPAQASATAASSETNSVVENPMQAQTVADIIRTEAVSFEYKSGDTWVYLESTEPAAETLTEILLVVNLGKLERRAIDVNSSVETLQEISLSTIEFNADGHVFLMPQGTALAPVGNVQDILPK